MCDDDWIQDAMADDSLVVQLLLRLHQAQPSPPPPPRKPSACLHLEWTVRQRRSRSASRHLGVEKKDEPTRASPTTPLSWSCATSASCGGVVDGYEESSLLTKPMESSRSNKVANPSETTTAKRSRKKKTLVELREEENLLLKERKNLKSELASLRLAVEKHRTANKNLKRMKLDFESGEAFKAAVACVAIGKAESYPSNAVSVSATTTTQRVLNDASHICPANASSKAQEIISNLDSSFLLPDLNLPVKEDLS